MANNNWEYSVDEIGSDNSEESDLEEDSDSLELNNIYHLPLTVIGSYAIAEQATVLSALQTVLGTGGLASALTLAFVVIGGLVVAGLCLFGGAGIAMLLGGVIFRRAELLAAGLALTALLGGAVAGGAYVVTGPPLLVGTVLSFTVIIYSLLFLQQSLRTLLQVLSL